MAKWQDSAQKILDNINHKPNNTSSATTSSAVPSSPKATDAPKSTGTWQDQAKQILDDRGYVPPGNRMYRLITNDGRDLGLVSYGAYMAITNNNLDNYMPKTSEEKKILEEYKKLINNSAPKTPKTPKTPKADKTNTIISDYVPGAYGMTKSEYDRRRASNPKLPEFGSYEYFKSREESLRPIMDEIADDIERADDAKVTWAKNYKNEKTTPEKKAEGERLANKFKYQDAIIAEYKAIDEQLRKFETDGVHYDKGGNIDSKSGSAEAKYASERYETIASATGLSMIESALGFKGELSPEKQEKYDQGKQASDLSKVEFVKEKAYNAYEKNKDNAYNNNLGGRIAGGYKIGDINIQKNNASYTSFNAGVGDLEAADVYNALSERIQKNNAATFQNNTKGQELLSALSQYIPQARDQLTYEVLGRAVGLATGTYGVGNLAGSAGSAAYMYRQTAGASFERLLRESELSVEDAKKLASSEALASGTVEFGLSAATGLLWKTSNFATKGAIKKVVSESAETITKRAVSGLMAKGISEKGANIIVKTAITAGKIAIDGAGEGFEEWIQEGMSIKADRYAKEGKVPSAFELFVNTFDLSQYSSEDFKRMNQSFLVGTIIGFGHGGFRAGLSTTIDATMSKVANAVDSTVLGREIIKSDRTDIVEDAVGMIKETASSTEAKAIERIETAIADGKQPSAIDVGTVVKSALTKTISVGDVFKDTKSGSTITVVERNAETTTVQVNTSKGVTTKKMTNSKATEFLASGQLEKIESPTETKTSENATTTEATSIGTIKTINLKRVGNFYEVYGEDAILLANELDSETTKTVVNGVETDVLRLPADLAEGFADAVSDEYNLVLSDKPRVEKQAVANESITTDETTPSIEESATESEISTVVNAMNDTFKPEAKEDLKNSDLKGDVVKLAELVSDFYKQNGTLSFFADYFTDKGAKVISAIAGKTDRVSNTSNDVVNVISETLTPEAKANLQDGDVNANYNSMAESLVEVYKESGSLEDFADFFTDSGKKVEAIIKENIDNTTGDKTETVAKDSEPKVLKNESESDTIEEKAKESPSENQNPVERKEDGNEQIRGSILPKNSRRASAESARKQVGRFSEFKQRNKGKNVKERKRIARELIQKGQVEKVKNKNHEYTLVNPEAYNDDMLSIVEEAKANGKEVGFFVGPATIHPGTVDEFQADGIKISSKKILLQYDGIDSPQLMYKHEHIHADWNTAKVQEISNTLDESLSAEEKQNIFEQERYAYYKRIYKDDKDAVWQEFVCDTMSGMNNYTEKYIDVVADYWYSDKSIESYNPADYSTSTDAGGERYSVYDYPRLTNSEWALLNRRLEIEIGNDDNFIDEYTKWLYASKNGTRVFAIYGIGWGEDATPLLAVGGSRADSYKRGIEKYLEGRNNGSDRSRTSVDRRIRSLLANREKSSNNLSEDGDRRTKVENGTVYNEQRESNGKGIDDRSTKNSNEVSHSLKDSAGRKLSKGQMEYFKDSTVRDENGSLKVMYRGDSSEFTVFDRKKTKHSNLYGRGFYFTDSKAHAEQYGSSKEFYLDIKNPLSPKQSAITKKQMLEFLKAIENDGDDYDLYNYGQDATAESVLNSVWGKGDFEMLQDINAGAIGDFVAAVELFNKVNGTSYDGIVLSTETVTFNSEQAKITSNKNPTSNPDYRYSISKEQDNDHMKAVESGDMETAQKMVDEAAEKAFSNSKVRGSDGKLRTVYHGRVSDFNVFDRQFANIEGDFGKGYYFTSNEYDVDANYASEEGPDLKNKIARYAEQLEYNEEYSDLSYEEREKIARQKFITSEPNTITAYLNMENPVYITPDEKGTLLDYNESYDEEYDEFGEPEGLLIDFIEALNNNASDYAFRDVDFSFLYEYAYDNGGVYASDAVKTIKNRIIDDLSAEEGNIATNEVIRLAFEEIGFDGIIDTSVYYKFNNMNGMDSGTTHYIVFDSEQIKSADPVTYDDKGNVIPLSERFNEDNVDFRYSIAKEDSYAPTFYSQMGKAIDEMKQDKIGAIGVIPYLKGRGVKNEEIKWSGLETFLEGKKSVTKAELQEFVAGSQLQIEETVLDGETAVTIEEVIADGSLNVMRGGKIYDSLTWDEENNVWVSDALGYSFSSEESINNYYGVGGGTRWGDYKLDGGENYREIIFKMPNSTYSNDMMQTHWGENAKGILAHARIQDFDVDGKKMLFIEEIQSDWHNEGAKRGYAKSNDADIRAKRQELENYIKSRLGKDNSAEEIEKLQEARREYIRLGQNMSNADAIPDAPFRDNYHEYVLKNLIRMAAEQGYDSIGWTTAEIQSKRWSEDYAEGYRIEYDQDIPKFLNKYGKKWGAKVGRTWVILNDDLDEANVWFMPVTDSMKESVLYEGQPRYSISKENKSSDSLDTQQKIEKMAKEVTSHEDFIELTKQNTKEFVDKIKENKNLQKRLHNAKRQMLLSPNPTVNATKVGKVTKDILTEMESTLKAKDLQDRVTGIYNEYFAEMKKAKGVESKVQEANDSMMKKFADLAVDIADSSVAYIESEYYMSLKSYLKDVRIKIPDYAKGEAHFNEFRKSHMGTFNLTNDGLEIDRVYQELLGMFPGAFSEDATSPADQLNEIADALERLKPYAYNPHSGYMQDAIDHIVYRFVSEADGIAVMPKTKAQKIAEKGAYDKEMSLEKERTEFERKLDRHKENSEKTIQALQKKIDDAKYVRYWEKRLSKEEKAQAVKDVRDKRDIANLKTQIRNIVSDMKKKLDKTEKNGGYPKELVQAAAEVCSVIDFQTGRTNKDGSPTKASLKLDALKMQYDALKNSPNYDFQSEHSEEISNKILKLHQKVENKRVVDLTKTELAELKDILSEISHNLSVASKQIGQANAKANFEIATEIINSLKSDNKAISEIRNRLLQWIKFTKEGSKSLVINPHRVFEMIANHDKNSAWWQLYDQILRGSRKVAKFTMDANMPFDELTEGGGNEIAFYDFRTKNVKTGIKYQDGTEVELPKSIICELVMLWDRKQGRSHLESGGIKIPDLRLFNKGQTAEALAAGNITRAITQSDITRLKGMLDSYDKAWIERSRHLFNKVAKDAINETSMQLVGRELAKADNYIRIYVDSDFVKKDIGKENGEITIEGHGSLKETTPDAKNPVVLRGLHENVYEHIDFASKYYGLAIPIRNFNKVYNIAINDNGNFNSVKNALGSVYGPKIRDGVVAQTIKDLQTPRVREVSVFNKVKGNWLNATFWANIRSTLKQTTSYWTASSILDEGSLVKGLASYNAHRKQTKAEIAKYSGTLYKRSQGLSTTELGDRANRKRLAGLSSKTTKFINEHLPVLRKIPEWIRPGNWLQSMDCAVSSALWDACKHQVSKTMNKSDEGYMTAVRDLYERVIEETQSNYDVLHRPEILKKSGEGWQMISMFQTDNLQQTGIIYGAFGDLQAKHKAYTADKNSINEQNLKEAKKRMGKAIRSRIYSSMWLATVSMLGNMLLRKFKSYIDDEEKEITSRSVLEQLMLNMANDMLGVLVPVVGQFSSKFTGAFVDGYDFMSVPVADVLNDFIKATSKIYKAYDEDGDVLKAWTDAIPAISNMTGVPAKNISDLFNAVKGYIGDIKVGEFAHDLEDYTSGNKSFYNYGDLASYIASGDKEKETKWLDYYSANGKEFAKGSLTKEIKPAYVQMYLDSPAKANNLKRKLVLDYDYAEADINEWIYDEYLKHIVPNKRFADKTVSNPEYAIEIRTYSQENHSWKTSNAIKAIQSHYKSVYKKDAEKGVDKKESSALRKALLDDGVVLENALNTWEIQVDNTLKKEKAKSEAEKKKFKD